MKKFWKPYKAKSRAGEYWRHCNLPLKYNLNNPAHTFRITLANDSCVHQPSPSPGIKKLRQIRCILKQEKLIIYKTVC